MPPIITIIIGVGGTTITIIITIVRCAVAGVSMVIGFAAAVDCKWRSVTQ
ncbi:MAG: hypothetical protein JWQ10_2135, partial [Herbaspirillum sp.]|nr:hypothetical protein [Herbaspirillum sp.]